MQNQFEFQPAIESITFTLNSGTPLLITIVPDKALFQPKSNGIFSFISP